MASETKAATSRRKSSADTKTAAPKTVKKTASTTTAPAKSVAKSKTEKAPAKVAKPVAKKPAAAKSATVRKQKSTGQPITADARLKHIEVAAYYIAEKSGFSRDPADCWSAAESEVDSLLLAGKL